MAPALRFRRAVLAFVLAQLRRLWRWSERTVSQQSMPSALIAPTGSEFRHEEIPSLRLNAERWRVTVGTTISFGQEIKEENGREHPAENEESADHGNAQYGV